jgi:hypothetical protein
MGDAEGGVIFFDAKSVRMTDAKEVGVGNPAEETFYHPNA